MEYLLSSKTSHTICDAIWMAKRIRLLYHDMWLRNFCMQSTDKSKLNCFCCWCNSNCLNHFFCVCCTLDCCWGKFNRRINWDISTLNFCVFFFYRHHLPLFYNGSATAALEVHSAQTHTQKKMRSTFRTFFLILHTKYMCWEICNSLANASTCTQLPLFFLPPLERFILALV